jgi:hypothetical protein
MVSNDGSIIATIITTHMQRNDTAAPGRVCPGVRIRAIHIAHHGDWVNVRVCAVSRGSAPPPHWARIDEAERTLAELDPAPFPPASRIVHELVVAGIAVRHLRRRGRALRSHGPSAQRATHVSLHRWR